LLPIDIPSAETARFVCRFLPAAGARILEVGCGRGEMAALLIDAGHRVTGLDTSAEALVEAAARGLSVHRAAWPDYADEPFDALLFTRSLHHIDPLEGALAQAHALLRPGGWLIVEDFAYLEADRETVTWLCHVLRLLDAGGALERAAHTFGRKLLAATEAYDFWRADHRHELHSAALMEAAIRARFDGTRRETAAYLYRFVCQMLAPTEANAAMLASVLALEQQLGALRPASLIGRRFVARR